ncbi:hypothetical protein S7335_1687 [Synechococcus sp. PCC 7335]|uniref:toxin-antitoxin system HicB family antitoxin n=1 Tax=Synechococcus sp. (strain ATCC 29403 / PCC 7335) TaxID=91464 RepID=UPI00017EE036|nr:toxin-antitoxin system HicB family antitoxin [Synechococcus sp. PCC 7335]EDX83990.1 hypothetical protein S7335_1687 [Synechococcus sp. PCC 7335]
MSRLTLRLPETLHSQLSQLAENEGVSLNQYIVYSLTRQIGASYTVQVLPEAAVNQQQADLNRWLQSSEPCSEAEATEILSERETAPEQSQLSAETVSRFQAMLQKGHSERTS